MGVTYEDRHHRLHQPIPHDPDDQSPIDTSDHPLPNYAKRIIAIHNLLIKTGRLRTFDQIRRVAEEVDAQFASGTPPKTIPPTLKSRLPTYYERRVLAIEAWLAEQGIVAPEELARALRDLEPPAAAGH